MRTDLLLTESEARDAAHLVTRRALIYMEAGLPLDQVLEALKVSRATWYRRVEALEAWAAANAAAARKRARRPVDHRVS